MTRLINKMDKVLLMLTFLMFVFGLFMILDASSMKSFLYFGVNTKYFYKQLVILIISFTSAIFIINIPLRKLKNLTVPVSIIIICMMAVLLVYGVRTNNSKSWLYIGTFGIQPSEFAKLAIILFTAVYYKVNYKYINYNIITSSIPLGVGAIFTGLTLLQPDGGTGLIIFFITMMLYYASPVLKEYKIKITLILFGFIILVLLVFQISGKNFLSSMQRDRFNFLKPCTRYQENTGYQVCNGYIAINNGKLISISPGNSKQKYLYLPEAYTDFIFPIIVEEFGLLIGILVILLYMIIIYRILVIAKTSVNVMNALICYGVACYIFLHVIINLVGVLGLLPLTGVPLPFLSYGGSFALTLTISLAIVQRVSIENYNHMQKKVLN